MVHYYVQCIFILFRHACRVWWKLMTRSGHSFGRVFCLSLHYIYTVISLLSSMLSVGNTFLTYYFLLQTSLDPNEGIFTSYVRDFLLFTVILMIVCLVIYGIGNKSRENVQLYTGIAMILGVVNILTIACIFI